MANPNLLSNSSVSQDILVESQLSSGNNDFVVPSGRSWLIRSFAVCNVSGASVTMNVWVIKSGGGARKILHNLSMSSGDTTVIDPDLVTALPEAATLRLAASAGAALDVTITGVVAA